jgi:hypothetical protein
MYRLDYFMRTFGYVEGHLAHELTNRTSGAVHQQTHRTNFYDI